MKNLFSGLNLFFLSVLLTLLIGVAIVFIGAFAGILAIIGGLIGCVLIAGLPNDKLTAAIQGMKEASKKQKQAQ
jgi:flagellar motor component MotA